MLHYVRQFFKIGVITTRLISETKTVSPNFFAFLTQVTHNLTAVKILNKIYRLENFRAM